MTRKTFSPRNNIRTAILVDGGFFIKRYRTLFRNGKEHTAKTVVENFYRMVQKHVEGEYLYRIIYYDCKPIEKKTNLPISGRTIDFAKQPYAILKNEIFDELKRKRKVALRLGELQVGKGWLPYPRIIKELRRGTITWDSLTDDDFYFDLRQKGVDIKIGLDISALAIKRLVDKIILISGDADFVPAAKLARREGIDFILDPMHNNVTPLLFEHIDGIKTTAPKPGKPYPTIYLE